MRYKLGYQRNKKAEKKTERKGDSPTTERISEMLIKTSFSCVFFFRVTEPLGMFGFGCLDAFPSFFTGLDPF